MIHYPATTAIVGGTFQLVRACWVEAILIEAVFLEMLERFALL